MPFADAMLRCYAALARHTPWLCAQGFARCQLRHDYICLPMPLLLRGEWLYGCIGIVVEGTHRQVAALSPPPTPRLPLHADLRHAPLLIAAAAAAALRHFSTCPLHTFDATLLLMLPPLMSCHADAAIADAAMSCCRAKMMPPMPRLLLP